MDESFDLPVLFDGKELLLNTYLVQLGYTHRFMVDINGLEVAFEPDEERSYRAIIDNETLNQNRNVSVDLLKAVAHTIESVIR